jgi:3-hydroxy-9,10-secoandrosta-1,3,5(10)-triene-9,17-dione monooxygenase
VRAGDPDYATWYGAAVARLHAAQAVVERGAHMFMEFCERGAGGGPPFGYADDLLVNMLGREALTMAWQVMQDLIVRTAGSSAMVTGTRLERIWRDMTMAWGHANSVMGNRLAREFTQHRLGLA